MSEAKSGGGGMFLAIVLFWLGGWWLASEWESDRETCRERGYVTVTFWGPRICIAPQDHAELVDVE